MATTGSISILKTATLENAFVQASDVEVEIVQPPRTFLKTAYVRITSAPTITAAMDIGYKIGTTTGNGELALVADGIIDNASSTTPFAVGSMSRLELKYDGELIGAPQTLATVIPYSETERTLFLNITTSNNTVSANGNVEFICEFAVIGQ